METPNKSKKPLLIGLVVIVVCAVAARLIFFKPDFLYAGTIESTKVDVSARVNSVLQSISVKDGQHVRLNDEMLALACEDYKIAAAIADENFDRAAKLFKEGSQSKETLDQLKNRKEDADLKIAWCSVKSPLSGTVLNHYHEVGEWVTQGTRLFTLANLKTPYAYIYVPQPLIAKLHLGQSLTGYLPELGMKVFEGTIEQFGETAEFTPKNVQTRDERTRLVFAVKITFKNDEEILKPGMSIEIKVPE